MHMYSHVLFAAYLLIARFSHWEKRQWSSIAPITPYTYTTSNCLVVTASFYIVDFVFTWLSQKYQCVTLANYSFLCGYDNGNFNFLIQLQLNCFC
jgi:hypothetical protein